MAFELVAYLRLKDEFTNRMKRVFAESKRFDEQIKKASDSTAGFGKKFSSAGSVATRALDRIKEQTARMHSGFTRAKDISTNALSKIGKGGQSMKNVLAKASEGAKNKLSSIGNGASRLTSQFSQAAGRIRNSLRNGIQNPAMSAKSAVGSIASAIGVVAIASKGFNMLRSSLDSAIARYDTLNNFPRVMQAMGFSAEESKKSIDRLAEGIDGLPTALDEIADTAQRIATSSGDLNGATETAIALNNALLASGSNSEKASRGTEQYLKALSTGRMELDSWTTLQETMGLGLNEVAKAFGITGDQLQNQLYKKLKSGEITMDAFNEKLIELSEKTGGLGDLAKDATGGLATAWGNMKTAIAKGVTGSIEAIDEALGGTGKIADIISRMKDQINTSFVSINKSVLSFVNFLKKAYDGTKPLHPLFKKIAIAAAAFGAAIGGLSLAVGAINTILMIVGLLATPMGLAVAGVAALAAGFGLAYKKVEPFKKMIDKVITSAQTLFKMLSGDGVGGLVLMKNSGFSDEEIRSMIDFTKKVREVFNSLRADFTEFSSMLSTKAKEAFGPIKAALGELAVFLAAKWEEMKPGMSMLAEAFSIGKEILVSVFTTLWDVLRPIFGALKDAFMIVADIAVIAWTNIIAPAIKFTMKIFQTLWAIVGPILKLLGSQIGFAFQVLKIVWDTIIKPVTKFLTNEFKKTLEDMSPVLDSLKGAFDVVGGAIEKVAGWFDVFKKALSHFKVPNWLSKIGGGGTVKFEGGGDGGGEGRYNGIKYVPRDGYPIRAHRGERVLTAKENKEYKGGGGVQVMVSGNQFHVRQESDIDAIANTIARRVIAAGQGGAV